MTGLNAALMERLACPVCRGALVLMDESLRCASGHEFPMVDGVPVLLPGEQDAQHASQREIYDRVYAGRGRYHLEFWQRAYVQKLERKLGWNGGSFVDVGAGGDGYTVIEAARQGAIAAGCDLSLVAMRQARRFAVDEGVGETTLFVVCTAESLPFQDGAFDFIGVPNSFDSMPAVLRPVYRWHDRRIGHLRQYSPDQLIAVTSAAGLQTDDIFISAHWAKVWQLAFHLLASRARIDDSRLWWWFERRDERAWARPNGLHTNLVAIKK